MKKLIAFALVAGFLCTFGVGCGGDTKSTKTSETKSTSGAATQKTEHK